MKTILIDGVEYEVMSASSRWVQRFIFYPAANYIVPGFLARWVLGKSKSPFMQVSLRDPGGWESMTIAYDQQRHHGLVDGWNHRYGAFHMALRNRRKLCQHTLARLLEKLSPGSNIVSIGAGPGANVLEPVAESAEKSFRVFCIDINPSAFDLGRKTAEALGILDRVEFIEGDAVHLGKMLHVQPHVGVLVGILEYLDDKEAGDVLRALHDAMPPGGAVMATTVHNYCGIGRFMRKSLRLHLVFRDVDAIKRLLSAAGFANMTMDSEPVGIYDTVVGYKA